MTTNRLHSRNAWWRQEDWLAVCLGALFLIAVLVGFRPRLPAFKWNDGASLMQITSGPLLEVGLLCIVYLLTSLPGVVALGANSIRYAIGFPFVFGLAWIAQILAGNATVSYWGIEYVIFALLIGLLISNTLGIGEWLRDAVRTEYYIKTGLVIMGATLLFQEIMTAGALGMLQAFLVVAVVWYISFRIAKRMRLDDEFAAILSSAVSICGVSAAIAACGAIQGENAS